LVEGSRRSSRKEDRGAAGHQWSILSEGGVGVGVGVGRVMERAVVVVVAGTEEEKEGWVGTEL
jgi:hypothetical protein